MLLSIQQQYILDALDKLGCLRKDQLAALLRAKFFPNGKMLSEGFVDSLLRQLRIGGIALYVDGEVVCLPGKRADPQLLEAIDVMLELSEGSPSDFSAEQRPPVLLRFTATGRRIQLFAVLHADGVTGLHPPPIFDPNERVVILFPGEGRPPELPVSNRQFYAVRQKDGKHRFYARDNT